MVPVLYDCVLKVMILCETKLRGSKIEKKTIYIPRIKCTMEKNEHTHKSFVVICCIKIEHRCLQIIISGCQFSEHCISILLCVELDTNPTHTPECHGGNGVIRPIFHVGFTNGSLLLLLHTANSLAEALE
jgi:hypothetical protein